MRFPSHLHRNRHGMFGFRVLVPLAHRRHFTRHEFRITLSTCDAKLARRIAMHLSARVSRFYARLPPMTSNDTQDQGGLLLADLNHERDRLVLELFKLAEDGTVRDVEREAIESRMRYLVAQGKRGGLRSSSLSEGGQPVAGLLPQACDQVGNHAEELFLAIARLDELNDAEINAAIALRDRFLRLGMSLQHLEIADRKDAEHERRAGDMERLVRAAVEAAGHVEGQNSIPTTAVPISTVIEAYRRDQLATGAWTPKSEIEIMSSLQLWIRIVEDQPIDRYEHSRHRDFKSTLQQLPANLNKLPQYRGRSIPEILALKPPPAKVNTVAKHLNRVSALFKFAVSHGYAQINPAAGMGVKNASRASEERDAFSADDLARLFGSSEYLNGGHRAPYMYWAPLIALYTGARQNEIAQLHLDDFIEVSGVPFISINAKGDHKRVKTKASHREIPIHHELLRLGLSTYAEKLRSRGAQRLFPELKPRRDGYGHSVSKWFNRYRHRCGIDDTKKVFHSFRHTVINQLKQANQPKERIAALVGHEDSSVTMGRYGKSFEPAGMIEVVSSLNFTEFTSGLPAFKSLSSAP